MILFDPTWIYINGVGVVDSTSIQLKVGDVVQVYTQIFIDLNSPTGPIADCALPGTVTHTVTNLTTGAQILTNSITNIVLSVTRILDNTFTVLTAGTYEFFRQGTFCENAEGWTEEELVIIPANLNIIIKTTGCKTISITVESEDIIHVTLTVTRVGDSVYKNILFRDTDPNTSNSNIANVALPGNGIYIIEASAPELLEDYCFIYNEYCDIQECVRLLTLDIFCNPIDDCGYECPSDKLVLEQKRFVLNKIMALFNQYISAIKFEEFEYLNVTTIDDCRDLILSNIANLVTELDRAVLVCGDCNKTIDSTDCGCADTLDNTEQGEPFP